MKPVLFISDLHLSEETHKLNQVFRRFLDETAEEAEALYILGDFFDYWLGDDLMTPWSLSLADSLKALSEKGVKLYFLPGNRDFLVGEDFCHKAGLSLLADPTVIHLGDKKILLKHGDDLCTEDKRHQVFRRLSRNRMIKKLFLKLSPQKRKALATYLRKNSGAKHLPLCKMQAVKATIVKEMQRFGANTLIHGHTHREMIEFYTEVNKKLQHIVLPDWGQKWGYLCYNRANSFDLMIKSLE